MSEWRYLAFDDAVEDVSGGNFKTKQNDYLDEGAFAIVDQGKALISGYTNDRSALCKAPLPVVVFGDHTKSLKFVDFPFGMGADGVKVLRTRIGLDEKFLYHYLRQLSLPDGGYDRHFKYLKREHIPVPPLAEQRRIAAILDQAETLRAQRRAALEQLDSLGRAVFLDMFGDPVSNPKRLPTASLTDVCHCYSGGTPSKANKAFWDGALPWFSAKDMKARDLFDSEDHIANTVPQTSSLKLLPRDTVVIVVRGMILVHTFPVCVLRIPATINQDLKALIPTVPINAQFLAECLRSQARFVLGQVSEAGHGTKRLDAQGLQKIRILQPGVLLEQAFATRIQAIEALKATHRAALEKLDALFTSLQHRAFAGEL